MNKVKIKRIIKNEYIYSVVTKIFLILIGVVHSALFARYLGTSLNGEIQYIMSIVAIGAIVITGGIHQAYPYFKKKYHSAEYLEKYMNTTTSIFSLLLMTGIILCILQPIKIGLIAILMVLSGYSTISGYILLVEEPNKRNTLFFLSHVIEVLLIVILMLFSKANLWIGLVAYAFTDIVKIVLFSSSIKIHHEFKIDKSESIQLYKYGFFPMIALLLTTLNYKIDIIMLETYDYISSSQLGIYALAYTISSKTWLIPDSLKVILISKLANGKSYLEVAKIMRISFLISVIVAICITLFGKPFIYILYGEEYMDAYSVICISVLGSAFMSFFKMVSQYNIMNKKQKINALMLIGSILINIILNLIFVPIYGIHGAAYATVIANLVCAITFVVYFSKQTKIKIVHAVIIQKQDWNFIKSFMKK